MMLPKKEKGFRRQQSSPAHSLLSTNSAFPFGSYPAPGTSAGARRWHRERKPTHPTLVYRPAHAPVGEVKGWMQRRNYEQTEKFQVQKTSSGALWSWAQVVAWFNRWREQKPRLKKNTSGCVSNSCQTTTNCS